jgi:integrative and conjugative element protein (TIGR02256 family)
MIYNKVYFLRTAIETIKNEITITRNRVETGGVLMGYYLNGNEVVVTHASLPGKNAIQQRNSVEFDIPFCQSFINDVYGLTNGYVSYIGDWHSHTMNILAPSSVDKTELKKIALSKKTRLSDPLMLIVYGKGQQFYGETFAYTNGLIYRIRDIVHSPYSFEEVIE